MLVHVSGWGWHAGRRRLRGIDLKYPRCIIALHHNWLMSQPPKMSSDGNSWTQRLWVTQLRRQQGRKTNKQAAIGWWRCVRAAHTHTTLPVSLKQKHQRRYMYCFFPTPTFLIVYACQTLETQYYFCFFPTNTTLFDTHPASDNIIKTVPTSKLKRYEL